RAMRRDAEDGLFSALVVFDVDRIGRDARRTMVLLHRLADIGVEVWDCGTGRKKDLDSFEGQTMTFLEAGLPQPGHAQGRKRAKAALHRLAESGRPTGRVAYGLRNVRGPDGVARVEVDEEQARVVREIHQRFADGQSSYAIARALNERGVPAPRVANVKGW